MAKIKKKEIKKFIPPQKNQAELIQAIFKMYSNSKTNRTGSLSLDESRHVFETINTRLGKKFEIDLVADFFKNLDRNGDGRIDINEFEFSYSDLIERTNSRKSANPLNKELIKVIFEMYSNSKTNKTGTLSLDESRLVFETINSKLGKKYEEEKIVDFFNNLDRNGDGRIDLSEFQFAYGNLY